MPSVSGSVDEVLVQLAGQKATGVADLRAGKKRWMFYLRDGALVWTRSNLKSEQEEAVREATGSQASGDEIAFVQAVRRVGNARKAELDNHTFHEGAPAKATFDLPLGLVLAEGVSDALGVDALEAELEPLLSAWPVVRGSLEDLGFEAELLRYLGTLDGGRTGADVVAFAPSEPAQVILALWAAWRLGLVEAGEAPEEASIKPAQGARRLPELDIGALIADARAEAAHAPSLASEERTDPSFSSLPGDEPSVPVAGGNHPLAGHLQELSVRIGAATNHFEVLGVAWDGAEDEFRAAYMKLAQSLHPDRYAEGGAALQEEATGLFDRVRAAWEDLGDEEKRIAYIDKVIHGKKTEEEQAMEQIKAYWSAEADFKRGLAAFKNGRTSQAHTFFEKAALAIPDELEWVAYHAYTSFAVERTRNPDRAEAHIERLKQVLDRNKGQERKLDMGWVLLGRSYRERGLHEPAKRCFVQALRYNPANADALLEMRRLKGDAEAAKKKGIFGGLFNFSKK